MVARPGQYHANFNGGELAPETHGRTDIKQYYSGAAEMTNVEPVAQGGFRLMARSRNMSRIRPTLEVVTPSSTTNNSGASGVGPRTVFQHDFATPQPIGVVAVRGFYHAGATVEDALQVEYLASSVWTAIGAPFRMTGTARNILRAIAPGVPVMAEAVRLRYLLTPSVTITVDEFEAKKELSTYTGLRLIPFTFSLDETYEIAITQGHIDIWREGAWIAAAELDETIDEVERIIVEQRFDTLLLFHEDMVSRRILRDGSDTEWPWDPVPYENVPDNIDYGGTYADVDDEWTVYIRHPSGGRYDRVVAFTIDGEDTAGVTTEDGAGSNNADIDDFCAAVKVAIEALGGISAGISVTRVSVGATQFVFKITFSGDGNEGSHVIAAQVVSHSDSAATVGHTVVGEIGGEELISASRGWPACARFYQDRLFAGGFRSNKGAFIASVTGGYFDLNVESLAASGAILVRIDTQGAEKLLRMERSTHLALFTTDAEYFISDRAISKDSTPTVVESSRNGSAPTVPIVSNENELLYVSKNRSVVYAAAYSDISQKFDSEPISLLASHLVSGIRDATLQRPEEETDAARYFLVRDDGAMAVGVLVRNQEISAFVRWTTDGDVVAAMVNGMNVPFIAVERDVDGSPVRFFERLETDLYFDCALEIDLEEATDEIDGLDDYEGAEIWADADGYILGPFTVEGGAITLPFEAEAVTVGRWTPAVARLLPIPRQVAENVVLQRPVRVHTVRGYAIATGSLAVGANDEPPEDVTLYVAGDAVDAPVAPYTGAFEVSGLVGWTDDGTVEVTQVRPGPLQIRDLAVEAKI